MTRVLMLSDALCLYADACAALNQLSLTSGTPPNLCMEFMQSRVKLFRCSFPPHRLQPDCAALCYNFIWRTLTQAVDVFIGRSYMGAGSTSLLPLSFLSNLNPSVSVCTSQFLHACAQHLSCSPSAALPPASDVLSPASAAAAAAAEEVHSHHSPLTTHHSQVSNFTMPEPLCCNG
jgi:hypothetical protein